MPRAAPVITAVLFSNNFIIIFLFAKITIYLILSKTKS
jgi:hypothetical protein